MITSIFRRAAEELKDAQMSADPVGEALRPGGFGVGIAAGPEHRDEDNGAAHFASDRIVNGNRIASVVDEQLFASAMFMAEHDILSLQPPACAPPYGAVRWVIKSALRSIATMATMLPKSAGWVYLFANDITFSFVTCGAEPGPFSDPLIHMSAEALPILW
jgi:hypothetical protein